MTRKPAPDRHLLKRWDNDPFDVSHTTRYFAYCRYTSTAKRDFSQDVTRQGRQIVTCQACLRTIGGRK